MTRPSLRRVAALALLCGAAGLGGCAGSRASMPSQMVRPQPPPLEPWRVPRPSVFALPSGMQVAVHAEPGLPLLHITAVVKAGSALDGEREGLAAAVAAMLVEGGAGVRSGPELAEALERLGDELQIVADADMMVFHLAAPPRGLQRALALLSDVLMRPRFDEEAWHRERSRRIAELKAEGDEPDRLADRVFDRAFFGRHPYGHPPSGTARALAGLEVADLRAFYQEHYGPRATTLLLAGDLGEGVAQLLASSFDGWTGTAPVVPPPPPPALQPGPTRLVLVDRPGAAQSQLRVGCPGVSRGSPDFPSAAVLDTVLGGSFTSRLVQNLREEKGLTYAVDADFVARDSPGPLLVRTAVRTDGTAAALREILAELRKVREPMSVAELDKARAFLSGELIEGFSDGTGASLLLAAALGHGVGADAWARLPDELRALDPARVAADAARLVDVDHLTIVVVGDRRQIEPQLLALPGVPPVEVVDGEGQLLRPAHSPTPASPSSAPPMAPSGPASGPAPGPAAPSPTPPPAPAGNGPAQKSRHR